MKYIITGGSGFLGSKISEKLIKEGHEVISMDLKEPRVNGVKFVKVNLLERIDKVELLKNPDVYINLAGKLIFGKWDENFKQLIRSTRVDGTQNLINLFKYEEFRPKVLVQASAVGIYGDKGEIEIDEDSEKGDSFLSRVAIDWEKVSFKAKDLGVKVSIIRNGHILGEGGLVGVLKHYYQWGIGGPLGKGNQYFPWIHVNDISNLYIKASQENYPEVMNGVAPEIIRNKEFSKLFAKVLKRPHVFFIPKFALKFLYGEFADEILVSQKIVSKNIPNEFTFKFDKLEEALKDILK
jgi:uncharacterized protein (TIGR01777 family)